MRAETRSGALGTSAVLAMQVMTADHLWVYIGVLVVSPIGMGLADPVFLRALSLSRSTYLLARGPSQSHKPTACARPALQDVQRPPSLGGASRASFGCLMTDGPAWTA